MVRYRRISLNPRYQTSTVNLKAVLKKKNISGSHIDIGKTVPSLKSFLIEPFNKDNCIINNVVELRTQVVDGTVFVI